MTHALDSERRVIVDHTSAQGPIATHMRGTMLVGSVENLRKLGVYERYLERLPSEHHDAIKFCIAASWVPMQLAEVHYGACDALALDDEHRKRVGELMAERVAATFLSALLRVSRSAGVDSFHAALTHNDRLYDRMYQGGGVRVFQTGPKDVVFENFGLPLAESRYWRVAYVAYLAAIMRMFAKTVYVKQVHASEASPHTIALAASWV